MLFLIFVAVVAALSATLYLFLSYRYSSWKRKGVAGPPATAFPLTIPKHIIGKEHYGDVVDRIYNQFRKSPIAGTYVFGRPVLHLHDPEIIKQVLIKEFQDFNGRGMYNDSDHDPISHGLFFLSGPKWRRLRVKLAPAFTSGKIKYMFETIQKSSEQLTKYLDDRIAAGGGSYCENSRPLMKRLFVDTLSEVIFGIESNVVQNPDSAFHKAIQKIVEPTLSNMWRLVMITFASDVKSFLRIHAVSAEIERFYTTLVRDSINYREQNKIERADILNLMMQLKNQGFVAPDRDDKKEENGRADLQRMTMDDIAAQAFIFVSAGFETSSTATSCTLYEIAKNPKILEKVLSEIDRVLSEFDGKITYESVMSMPYLEMCINETLRKYPALPYVSRQAMVKRKIPLTDVVVEKDTLLIVPVRALNYDPEYWPDPERYDPERFSEEQKASRSSGLVYMPFGEGPRICIAGRLGLVQVKTALATVLSKYTVSIPSDSGSKLSMEPRSFSNAPGTPLNVIFKPRKPMYFIRGKAA